MAFMQSVKKFIRDEEGAVTIEYALVAAIIAIGLIAALNVYQTKVRDLLAAVGTQLDSVKAKVAAVAAVAF